MLILRIHLGYHDDAVFDDYRMVAAVQLERLINPLYADILAGFKWVSSRPVLINTSFDVHKEPIVNTPGECAQALADNRINYVVTKRGVYAPGSHSDG